MDALWIKTNELIKKSLELWEVREWNIEEIDPVVKLLFAAVANESLQLDKNTRELALILRDSLLNSLLPLSMSGPKPAFTMIQAAPLEASLKLNEKFSFDFELPGLAGNKKETTRITFRPAFDTTLFKAALKYIFTFDRLVSLSDYQDFYTEKYANTQNSIWVGLKSDDTINSLDGLSLFFNIPHPGLKQTNQDEYNFIDQVSLWSDNREFRLTRPIDPDNCYHFPLSEVHKYSNNLASFADMQADVMATYAEFYYRIDDRDFQKNMLKKKKYPDFFPEIFEADILKQFREDLYWLEFRFGSIKPDLLKNINIHINAFPVLNLKQVPLDLDHEEPVKRIPVSESEELIGVISYRAFDEYRALITASQATHLPFLIRDIEMEKFAQKDLTDLIEDMTDRFISDNLAFQEEYRISPDDMNKLREAMKPVMAAKLKNRKLNAKRIGYAIFNPGNQKDIASVELLCCISNGAMANGIAAGERLKSTNAALDQNEIMFLTKTMNGRNSLSSDEKATATKRLLMSGNKIVTREDIREFCYGELGNRIKGLHLRTASYMEHNAIRRCLVAEISLKDESVQEEDLLLLRKSMENKIRMKSSLILPVKINFIPKS